MVLSLSGDLTIQHVVQLKQQLQQSLAESEELIIDLSAAEVVDAAFLQLLYAVQTEALRQRKEISLKLAEDPASPFHQACLALGLERICPV